MLMTLVLPAVAIGVGVANFLWFRIVLPGMSDDGGVLSLGEFLEKRRQSQQDQQGQIT